ncbi:MAG: RDD family protein [Planctomycetaceae bacterium]
MPIKVRCGGCSTVLNAPDKAAGKTLSCPKCKEKIRVPAGNSSAKPAPKAAKAPPKKRKNEDALFGGMNIDDYDMDHDEEQICPYCAAEMEYDDDDELIPVCRKCGMNIETGQMDAKEKKRRARKGPPLEEYWGNAWKESWKFVLQYPGLAVRTGLYTALFGILATTFSYLITQETRIPIILFYAACSFLFSLGTTGWYWVLSKRIISATVMKEELQTDRIFFDIFECISVGLRALFWPYIVMLPIIQPPLIVFSILLLIAITAAVASASAAAAMLTISALPAVVGTIGTLATKGFAWETIFAGFNRTLRSTLCGMSLAAILSLTASGVNHYLNASATAPVNGSRVSASVAASQHVVAVVKVAVGQKFQFAQSKEDLLDLLVGMPMLFTLIFIYACGASIFPIAQVHFTSKYTYKGWILWELLKLMPKNLGGAMYWVLIAFVVSIPAALVNVGVWCALGHPVIYRSPVIVGSAPDPDYVKDENGIYQLDEKGNLIPDESTILKETDFKNTGVSGTITLWILGLADITDPNTYGYYLLKGIINLTFAFIIYIPVGIFSGFGLLFMMKANAEFARYYIPTLELVNRVTPNTPATFWVRYLAHNVDVLLYPFSSFIVTGSARAMWGVWALNGLGLVVFLLYWPMFKVWFILWVTYNWWMYWVIQESSPLRTTMGKDGFGLIVIPDEDPDKPITVQQANIRFFMRNMSYVIGWLPFLMMVWDKEKKTMHDKVSKTRVVWKGDK